MLDEFQSTHPARGATSTLKIIIRNVLNFNPRTPRGVRLISAISSGCSKSFQSTHPARGATVVYQLHNDMWYISIHAPREGCDARLIRGWVQNWPISIHAPREGCDGYNSLQTQVHHKFQSTHPARGATALRALCPSILTISIHAPREGCDCWESSRAAPTCDFNPRTPRGVRQQTLPKSREFAWLNLLICTRGRRLSIQKQTRLCSIKLSFMLFGCEPAGEGVSSWTSHATKSKVRLEGRSAYSQSARSSAHSDFPGNKSGDCPVRGP